MSRTTPSVVCFDLGGVVVRICRTWAEGCKRAEVPVRDGDAPDEAIVRGLVVDHQTGAIDADTYAERLSEAFAGRYSVDEIMAVHEAWVIGVYDGIAEIIEGLRTRGVRTAALSNTDARHWIDLTTMTPIDRLQVLLASHELGLRKPDPAIYRVAEQRLGASGGEILFFDDLPENIDAARGRGWRAELIDPVRETADQIQAALERVGL